MSLYITKTKTYLDPIREKLWEEYGQGEVPVLAYNPNSDGTDAFEVSYTRIPNLGNFADKTYVDQAIANLIDSAPDLLNTLNELSAALANDPNFATTIATQLTNLTNLVDSKAELIYVNNQLVLKADSSYVDSQLALKANSSSLSAVATSGSYNDLLDKPLDMSLTNLSVETLTFSGTGPVVISSGNDLRFVASNQITFNDLVLMPLAFSSSYNDLIDIPDLSVYQLSATAFSGDYNDLINKPVLLSGDYNDLINKPDLSVYQLSATAFSGDYNDLINKPAIPLTINDLSDVVTTDATNGQFLSWNGTSWIPSTVTQFSDTLARLAISVDGSLSYNNITGVISYTAPSAVSAFTNDAGYITASSSITGNAATATKLQTARTLSLTGDASGSVSFDGSADASITVIVADNSHTHTFANITATPTTIAGYGITDAFSGSYNDLTDKPIFGDNGFDGTFDSLSSKPTTLVGYGITDGASTVYVDTAISNLVNGASAAYDTLKEIQDAMATDAELSAAISGLTIGNATQTVTAGSYLTGGGSFTANQTTNSTITLAVDATSTNTASKVVVRDASGNFSAGTITAALSGNATTATSASKWTTARTITLSGDLSGSVSIDGSANATLTATVLDDSHAHVIADVDGLQTALDGKSDTSHNHTLDGLSNTTITSNTAGEILKWNGTAWVNNTLAEAGIQPAGSYLTGNQTITLSGDVSGSGTTSIEVTIADDSHNHIISNVDGLQTALDGKSDTSHNHTFSNLTGVNVTSAVNGDFLYYNSATSQWTRTSSISYVSGQLNVTGAVGLSNTGVNFNNYGGRSNYGLRMPNTTDVAIQVNGTDRITATSAGIAVTGAITATGEVTAYFSDERLKKNIEVIPNAIEKIKAIRGVTFDPNETALALGVDNKRQIGVIAQEVEMVIPEIVVESAYEGYKTVKYDKLTALLIEAVKAQQEQIDSLKAEISDLRNLNNTSFKLA